MMIKALDTTEAHQNTASQFAARKLEANVAQVYGIDTTETFANNQSINQSINQ